MDKLQFKTDINAPASKVWKVLWDDASYRQWTSAFSEGSHAISDWKEGSRILFLDSNKDGMFSMIDKKVDNEKMIFKHMGVIAKGVEQAPTEETKGWQGATERYYLSEANGHTELTVEMDSTDEFAQYFKDTFPKALAIVKDLAEE